MTLVKVRQKSFWRKNWPAKKSVKVWDDYNVKQDFPGAGWASGFGVRVPESIVVIRNLSRYGARPITWAAFLLTARQYGEVVLPDASTGQGPGTPRQRGQKAVTVQGGYGALFAVRVQILLSITRVAVQGWSEPRIYPRLQVWWRALAQCRGTNCLGARN
jgi:hypothetical protein